MQEEQLVYRLKEKNAEAFRFLVDTFRDRVFNICLNFLQSRQDAEELTQDVFVEVHRSVGKFRMESSLSTWIYKIAVNKSLEHRRKQKRKKRFAYLIELTGFGKSGESHEGATFDHPGIELENRERGEILFRVINELPDNQKAAFILCEVEGLSYKDIASILDTSVPSVESLIFRAKQSLRNKLYDIYKKQGI